MMRLMVGNGTPMAQGEVYTAIQSGVLEGGAHNELIFANPMHSEVAPYYTHTRHLRLPSYLITHPAGLEPMSPEHRTAFTEELSAAMEGEAQLWKTEVEKAIQAAKDAGAQFNEVDSAAFADAIRPLVESKLTTDFTREIHAKVRAAASAG